jgi:hypothetical protein
MTLRVFFSAPIGKQTMSATAQKQNNQQAQRRIEVHGQTLPKV